MSLIDGVITAGEAAGVQCLQFVNNITGGAGAGFSTAGDLATSAAKSGTLSATPALGDVAVWGNGVNGASSSGHAGIVTGLANGLVQVTSTNWPGGAGATQYTVGKGNNPIGMGQPSGYIDPTAIGGKNIITGATSTTGMQQTGAAIVPGGAAYSTLSQSITAQSSIIPGEAALSGFASWVSQGTLLRRIGFSAVGVFLMWYGLHLLTSSSVPSPVEGVTSLANKVPIPE